MERAPLRARCTTSPFGLIERSHTLVRNTRRPVAPSHQRSWSRPPGREPPTRRRRRLDRPIRATGRGSLVDQPCHEVTVLNREAARGGSRPRRSFSAAGTQAIRVATAMSIRRCATCPSPTRTVAPAIRACLPGTSWTMSTGSSQYQGQLTRRTRDGPSRTEGSATSPPSLCPEHPDRASTCAHGTRCPSTRRRVRPDQSP